ncbi:type II toxin-antitoxin system HipA family toxin [Pseudomonas aeruginosa]|uniref:type II toxin-antitoxin system HipA family toxin n=1 Tax=Pseudomonas aeruginosa TaxID=287 RepID=UPI000EAC2D02|nr:type II toxin-antitoxin system HipA family toxin [Pseudomonas aeruginosa]HCT7101455.1 type II toxin-antitoxin system HipA family toxin [Pseudomonas aeruginosa]HEN8507876.1 type II toxin-antitoxin system HipA family toxin [Pseudomonas aeruginosa]HEN8756299.1 type II toxin-antitoxin system HipA family toxin [Pseudomonas aeruginosa]HEN8806070.1 type II toxin-antitoxin system HipA family toxin [Pseudomonas aeruginosa]
MPKQVDVYYDGWGEHWRWGSLVSSTALTGRPLIAFEYSEEALARGLELSALRLPLKGPRLRRDFPDHQLWLPGPVYDSLPDGWGMLLMDRLFKRRGLNPAHIGPLERLAYIGPHAMGAMSFEPVAPELSASPTELPLAQLAAEVQNVLAGEGGEFLQQLLLMGGSPHGARPKALLYRDPGHGRFSTAAAPALEAWMIKFPAAREHPEVCAIEAVYAQCLRECTIDTPDTEHFELPNGQAAFATRRFDRQQGMRVPMQSLAAFTGADFRAAGALDYTNFLRATQFCSNDVREKAAAFERIVFNVVFNNRDDHPKNFAYLMSPGGQWKLAPAYDVTFCEGPGGYHQMDVMGEALHITRKHLLALAVEEAELSAGDAADIIERICQIASGFTDRAKRQFPGSITQDTLRTIQARIDHNIERLS